MKKSFFYLVLTCIYFLLGTLSSNAQTILKAGEVVILEFNGVGTDGFTFMPLVPLSAGTTINFTDYGWNASLGSFHTIEEGNTSGGGNMITYTAPTAIAAGTLIRQDAANVGGSAFTATAAWSSYNFSSYNYIYAFNSLGSNPTTAAHDGLLVFQGAPTSPTFITGYYTGWWGQGTLANYYWSDLPAGLTDGVNAVHFPDYTSGSDYTVDDATYTGPKTSADADTWRSRVANSANWTTSATNTATPTLLYSAGASYPVTSSVIAPTATTSAVSSVSSTGASLNGSVNANNASTTVSFEYGLTTAYGSSISATPSSVTGTSATSVSAALSGLVPNTTYHYRVVGVNSAGTTQGSDASFTTLAVVPTATTSAASSVSSTAVTLNGSVNANNASTTVTFEYGLTTAYGSNTSATPSSVTGTSATSISAALSGLVPNTTYHYRVVGVNSAGSTQGSDATFTTSAIVPTVTTSAASSVTSTGATLNGTVNANNASTVVTFEYGTTTAYGTTATAAQSPVTGTSATSVTYALTGLVPNTTYYYRVVGLNTAGATNGTQMTFTTVAVAPTVTTVAASSIASTTATLNGTVNANNASTVVTFEYGTTTAYGTTATAAQSPVTGTSATSVTYALTGLVPNTAYYYRVVGVNSAGTTQGSDASFTTLAVVPTATTSAASSVSSTGATLNGTVNANNASTVVTFEYGTTTAYGTTATAAQSPVTGTSATSVTYALTGLVPNTTYHYRVVGVNSAGTTQGSDATFTTSAIVPTVTTSAASSVSSTAVTLNGSVNANNASTTVTFEYGLTTAYGSSTSATPSSVTGTSATSVSAALTGLVPNTTYHYRVVGVNSAGTTQGSDASFTTLAVIPTATASAASSVSSTGATLNGTLNANNASTVVTFEYGTTTAYGTTATAAQSPVTGTSATSVTYALTGLVPNTTYHYRVVGVNSAGTTQGSDASFTTLAVVPTATTSAASSVSSTAVTLNGSVNANNSSTVVTFEYGLTTAYGTSATVAQSPVTGTSATSVSAVLSGLVPNTTYHYRVVGVNSAGTTQGSDASFTTLAVVPTATTSAASSVSSTAVTLNGSVNANNASTTVTFEYGLTTAYGSSATAVQSPVTGTSATSVSAALSGLAPNTTYHYRIKAVNSAGTTQGLDATFTTSAIVPTATTSAASSISSNGATVNGSVNANNASTVVTFEYGLTTAYGTSATVAQSPVTGTSATSVSAVLSGLTPNTTYYYRVKGVNTAGTTSGTQMTFTTVAVAPTVSTVAASSVTSTGATLNGTVNANNASTVVTFEYGTTTAYGTTATAAQSPVTGTSATSVTYALTGLVPNTTYHYRVVGVNSAGTTQGSDATFTTSAIVPTVTTSAASSVSSTAVTLNGSVNANNASTVVTFEYGLTTAYGTSATVAQSPVTGTSATSVSAALSGLTPNTTYYYRVKGVNTAGTTNGTQMTFTTVAVAPTVSTVAASSVTSTGATLNGTVNANNASTVVTFEYGTTTAYGTTATAAQSPVTGTSATSVTYVLTGLVPNTTYYYRVVGLNTAGTTSGTQMTFTTVAVAPAVSTVAASSVTSTGATLNGIVNANNASTVVTFEYGTTTAYGTTATAAQSPVTGTSATSVSAALSGLVPNTTYHFRVKCVNTAGSSYGLDQTFATDALTLSVSASTASVAKTAASTATVNVTSNTTWTAVSDQSWLSVSPSTPTLGNAVLTFTAGANPTVSTRVAAVTLTAIGLSPVTLTVTQAAGDATSSISVSSINAVKTGGASTVNVTSNTSWNASSDQTWAVVSQDVSSGNGVLTVTSSANPTVSARTATVTITVSGGVSKTITVTQAAGDASCSITTSIADFTKTGGNASVNVSCNTSWTVVSNQTWLTVTPAASTTGDGIVDITATANTGAARTATVTITVSGGITKTITVTQAAGTTVGLEDVGQFKFKVYPNPTTDVLTVDGLTETAVIIISDLSGNVLLKEVIVNKQSVSVISLPKGSYLARIVADAKSEAFVFMKK